MTENEFLLEDRLAVIRDTISKYGEENFYLSFSGGKDSTVVHHLLDMAIPGNKIPRVFANTGIEYNAIVEFVREREREDNRFVMIHPSVPIKKMLETEGYPFKSKKHSSILETYQKYKTTEGRIGIQHYLHISDDGVNWSYKASCPQILKYQFNPDYPLKISDKCCQRMKEDPLRKWQRENKKSISILGLMREEGGRRAFAECVVFTNGKLTSFQPLAKVTHEWEHWFIEKYKIPLCSLYYEPYNFERTGCKGCPFASNLQRELDIIEKYFPSERRQCEIIWKPVYDEYRRIGYRLDKEEQMKLF